MPYRSTESSPRRPFCRALLLGLLGASPAFAADPGQPGQEALRQHQQQQLELQRMQLEERQRQLQRGNFGGSTAPAPVSPPIADHDCWPLSGTRVGGVTLLSRGRLDRTLGPLISECMGPGQINRLLAAITHLYVDAGYVAARPYLANPPEAGQSLDILVDEGYVESIELDDQGLPVSLRGAFPDMLGKPLNLRDLEQGLDQLNRLRSVDLAADIAPGSQPGASRILLRKRGGAARWSLGLGLDNLGSLATGRDRGNLSLGLDSPLELNDSLLLSASDTLNRDRRYSRSSSLYYAIPYGYWTYSLFASHAEFRSPLRTGRQTFYQTGATDLFSLRADRVLWRGQRHQLSANLQLARKDVDSYLGGIRLSNQSPRLSVVEAGLNLFGLDSAVWSLDLGYARGLSALGADRDRPGRADNYPRAQFDKYRLGLNQWRNGQLAGQAWQWQSQFTAQYSTDPLPAIEQLLATDDSAVRGFRRNSVSGAIGAVWRNTLRLPLRSDLPVQVTPRLGLDHGWVKLYHGVPGQYLSGASAGLNLSWKQVQLDLDYQRSLSAPAAFRHEPESWLLRLSLQI
ncbi:TPA: ShlB/FhaC/HecB family hemolysin secretion/activation protein [Pseudomonas aeruginosa]|uniref:ShlB/FhaC/HecB family hemolysin secretion/activation protein n=1 Tax=Pseudomonas aeruginosa TaxID=287 RepID=UPI0039A241A7|nr:Hemolysin transporter protein ShlB [Pseudomonas aeruginosa]HCE9328939.1 ShlB/FhaC/HecB family hemolysin secretion/activation protein [Pseudomonas aeruginosa]HCE9443604.1 ShlB/FhaC/HecB family hemolysin secretion/activation protein [Pseudomonas aeruginosa]HCK4343935.1 ShlB/FhaC/HecB family hemolysin secretion/activation protein [Pseudomonas aeruginosa]